MATPSISVRLDPDVRAVLEHDAKDRGVGLSTYLRELASERAKAVRNAAIREESRRVSEYVADHPESADFYDFWTAPTGWDVLA